MLWNYSVLFLWLIVPVLLGTLSRTSTAEPQPTPSTIVDILSADVGYSYFLRELQTNGLIPLLNQLENVTLLAPINLAYAKRGALKLSITSEKDLSKYIINQKFRVGYMNKTDAIFETLYEVNGRPYIIKVSPDVKKHEYLVEGKAAIVEPDIYAKHQHSFIQGIDEKLPDKDTICDFFMDEDQTLNGKTVSLVKDMVRLLIADTIEVSEIDETTYNDVYDEFKNTKKTNKKKKKKKKITIPNSCEELFNNTRSFILPTDDYIRQSLPDLDIEYYASLAEVIRNRSVAITGKAVREIKVDILNLLESLMSPDLIGGENGTTNGFNHHKSKNSKVSFNSTIEPKTNQLLLNGKISMSLNTSSVVFANGIVNVFHNDNSGNFFHDLGLNTVEMIPRKALYAIHYSSFVKELEFRSLGYLIDGSVKNQTIFLDIDQDDYTAEDEISLLVSTNSFSSKQSLLYQFVDESVDIEKREGNINNGLDALLNTKMCSNKKIGENCFKLKISALKDDKKIKYIMNDEIKILTRPIRGANDTIFYIVDKEISPPSSFGHSLVNLLSNAELLSRYVAVDKKSCLSTIEILNEFNLMSLEENKKGYTVFLPCAKHEKPGETSLKGKKERGAWKSLGLILRYLKSNPKLFEKIMKGIFVEDLIYSNFGLNRNSTLLTENLKGDTVLVNGSYDDKSNRHFISLNDTKILVPINSDIFFNEGVIHVTDKLIFPDDFKISFLDLVKTTFDLSNEKFSILNLIQRFPSLMKEIGLDGHILSSGYSLLVPSPESLKSFNITEDFAQLDKFFEFHLIPNDQLAPLLDCVENAPIRNNNGESNYIHTNLTGPVLTCDREKKNKHSVLRLESLSVKTESYNKDHEVRIMSHGCTSFNSDGIDESTSCVFLLDKPLNLQWLNSHEDFLPIHLHLGFVSVGIGVILGIVIFGGILFGFIAYIEKPKKSDSSLLSKDFDLPPHDESSFIRVLTDEGPTMYDRGYETDIDMLKSDRDLLIPAHAKKKFRRKYGAIEGQKDASSNNNKDKSLSTAPRNIQTGNIIASLNRDRNLPGVF